MGNQLCGAPTQGDIGDNQLRLVGHIKNSQTRGLMSILDAARIPYKFDSIIVRDNHSPIRQNVQTNT